MMGIVTDLRPSAVSIVLFLVGWSSGWFLLAQPRRLSPAPVPAAGPAPARPSITLVVPARNEERSLPLLLASLDGQRRPGDRLIVVDDHSTDATAAIAAAADGVTIISAPPLPSGWAGKPHACHVGASVDPAHDDDVLVFLDADVRLGPGVLDALAADVVRHPDQLVSVQPWHTPGAVVEQLSMLPNVLALMGAAAFSPLGPERSGRVAFGPVMACRRSAYERAGGHAHPDVRATILEDIALARRFAATAPGRPRLFVGEPGRITFRMYPGGLGDVVEGWTKGLGIGIDATPWWAALLAAAWVTSLAGGWLTSPWFALASLAQLAVLARRAGRFSAAAIVTYPIAVVFLVVIVVRSIGRRRGSRRRGARGGATVSWKGRDLRPDQPTSWPGP